MEIIGVHHERDGRWHKFTSPHIPGLHMVAEDHDLAQVYSDIPAVIAALIEADFGISVRLHLAQSFSDYVKDLPDDSHPESSYYTIEKLAA